MYECSGFGNFHYNTFDGQTLHSQRNITYTFAASTKEAQNFFAVKVKNEYRGKSQVSYTRIVDIKLNGVSIRLLPGNEMLVSNYKLFKYMCTLYIWILLITEQTNPTFICS